MFKIYKLPEVGPIETKMMRSFLVDRSYSFIVKWSRLTLIFIMYKIIIKVNYII